ncbi:MAG TPA: hypothetical protein VNK95_17230 [Caldilineaceae bacterium]|nr:hypothetical protein [Caldilineaceae bacterium]
MLDDLADRIAALPLLPAQVLLMNVETRAPGWTMTAPPAGAGSP